MNLEVIGIISDKLTDDEAEVILDKNPYYNFLFFRNRIDAARNLKICAIFFDLEHIPMNILRYFQVDEVIMKKKIILGSNDYYKIVELYGDDIFD